MRRRSDEHVWEIMVNAPDLVYPGQTFTVPVP